MATADMDDEDIFTPPPSEDGFGEDRESLAESSISTLADLPTTPAREVVLPGEGEKATFVVPAGVPVKSSDAIGMRPVPPPSDKELRAMEARLSALMRKLKTGTATLEDRRRMAELGARMESLAKSVVDEKMRTRTALKTAIRTKEKEVRFAERRKEIRAALKVYEEAEKVNLLFMVDATGSMAGHIDAVKSQIREIVDNMRRSHAGLKMHVGFLAYRDHCDESSGKRFEVLPFTNDLAHFESFVGGLSATGGGDTAEDIHGALQVAGQQDWSTGGAATRVLIHIGDAPCHGSMYHDGCDDNYASGDPYSLQAVDLLRKLQRLEIDYTFGRINSSTDKMIRVFNEELGGQEYIKTCEVHDTKKVTKIVTSSLRASIAKTASCLRSRGTFEPAGSAASTCSSVVPRTYRLVEEMPSWSAVPAQTVFVYSNKPVKMEQLRGRGFGFLGWSRVTPTDGTSMDAVRVKIAPHPFAEGELRLARYAQLITKGSTPHVLKEFKVKGDGVHTLERYLRQIEVSTIASYLAAEYNRSARPSHCGKIRFLTSHAVEVEEGRRGKRFYNLEKMLPMGSKFIKFSNNIGYWDDDHFDETLARFTKWTYEITHEYMMVVDLQGIKTVHGFVLTDPVLHCKDLDRFGSTNMGQPGMDRCLKSLKAYIG